MRVFLTAATFALLAACASAPTQTAEAPSGRDCFRSADVTGYSNIDDDTLGVRVGANRNYALTAPRLGRDLRYDFHVALRADTGWICTGNGLGVEVIGGEPRRSIQVRNIARVDEAAPAAQGS